METKRKTIIKLRPQNTNTNKLWEIIGHTACMYTHRHTYILYYILSELVRLDLKTNKINKLIMIVHIIEKLYASVIG